MNDRCIPPQVNFRSEVDYLYMHSLVLLKLGRNWTQAIFYLISRQRDVFTFNAENGENYSIKSLL